MISKETRDKYQTVIGLEVHAQLDTKSKAYSNDANQYGASPNSNVSVVSLGHPGTLPVPNKRVIEYAVRLGLATESNIREHMYYARKNYFYPDLPKGYQTSQLECPIVGKGYLDILLPNGEVKRVGVTRAHLEEDAGKSLHESFHGQTGIDLNRAGIPLLEVVSEPEISSAVEAVSYMKTLHHLVKHLDICDGHMQEGGR